MILSYNICGVGCSVKRKSLSSLIRKEGFDVCLLQETKAVAVSDKMIFEIWGGTDVEWSYNSYVGFSGGLINMWRKGQFSSVFSFQEEGFLGVCGMWKNRMAYVINVYSSCLLTKKRVLWNELMSLKLRLPVGDWMLGGDFNATRSASERKSDRGLFNSRESDGFNCFIEEMELVDPAVIGK